MKDTQCANQLAQTVYCPNLNDNVVGNTAHSSVLIPKPASSYDCEPAPFIPSSQKPS